MVKTFFSQRFLTYLSRHFGILSGQAEFESGIGHWLFSVQNCCQFSLFSLGVGLFLTTCNRTMHTLPSSLLFPIIIYHCENYQFQANNVKKKEK